MTQRPKYAGMFCVLNKDFVPIGRKTFIIHLRTLYNKMMANIRKLSCAVEKVCMAIQSGHVYAMICGLLSTTIISLDHR